MKSKGMILAAIIIAILMVVFLVKAFNSIQKADISIEISNEEASQLLIETADLIISHYDVDFVDEVSLSDIKLDMLLVDHLDQSVVMIKSGKRTNISYDSLPVSVSYCNTYIVSIDGRDTMIVNADDLLGDAYVRAVAHAYHYRFAKLSGLNPETIDYFVSADQNFDHSFNRYMMIESSKEAYLNEGHLDVFNYYFDEWTVMTTDEVRNNMISYDYYDGLLAFIKLKVMLYDNPEYDINAYLKKYKNDLDIYDQDDEYEIMGLLYCLLAEREGIPLLLKNNTSDPYTILLSGSVIGDGHEDELKMRSDYESAFEQYISDTKELINSHKFMLESESFHDYIFTSEQYDSAVKYGDDTYIYKGFSGRLKDGSVVRKDIQIVKISVFKIYYMK